VYTVSDFSGTGDAGTGGCPLSHLGSSSKEQNKALFDNLYSHRESIEAAAGEPFVWERKDDVKASKIYLTMSGVDISNESDWPRMAQFHAEGCKTIINSFGDALSQFFSHQ